MKDNAFCVIIEFDLKVLLEDLANNRECHKTNLRVFRFGNDWVVGIYQCAFGRENDSGSRGINDEDLPGKSERLC